MPDRRGRIDEVTQPQLRAALEQQATAGVAHHAVDDADGCTTELPRRVISACAHEQLQARELPLHALELKRRIQIRAALHLLVLTALQQLLALTDAP